MSRGTRQSATRSELLAIIARLEKRIAELEAEVARLRKDSSTSSKPPSSDITKPPKPPQSDGAAKRLRGGQPGHVKQEREPFAPEEVDAVLEYGVKVCPDCGGAVEPAAKAPRVIQRVEVLEKPIRIEEHRGLAYWCACCQKTHYGPLPPEVEAGGLFGPRLTAQCAYMKCAGHMSLSAIRAHLRDVLGLRVSRGYLSKVLGKAAGALEKPYAELLDLLPSEPLLNVDETGHKENGETLWTWCFRARDYALFKIDPSRGSQVLFDVLGAEFAGVLGCDYFSAYRKYMKDCDARVQFCLAHLIRELKFLATLPDKRTAGYGKDLLEEMRALFAIIHRRAKMGRNAFAKALCDQRRRIIALAIRAAPATPQAQTMAKRFERHGAAYFQFITTPGLEPTNNLAEQAIRFVVIDRHVTQGTRSPRGRQWCERIWTIMATCAIQGRSAYHFLAKAIEASFKDEPAPSLRPNTA